MEGLEETTFGVPRFLSFIGLGYLLEAAKAADQHLASKLPDPATAAHRDQIGNINATMKSPRFFESFGSRGCG
jgi:hypothetical protein